MPRSVEPAPAALGLTIAFPLRLPAGGVVSTCDAEQLQRTAEPAAVVLGL